MPADSEIQYTVRGVPSEIDQALRRKARERRISLNQLLVEELTDAVETASARRYRSLKGIAGRWQDDPEFDRALEEQRQIDRSLWK